MTLVYIRCNKQTPSRCDEREKELKNSDYKIIKRLVTSGKKILKKEIKELKNYVQENNIDEIRVYYSDEENIEELRKELGIKVFLDDEVKIKSPSSKLKFFIDILKELKDRDITSEDKIFSDVSKQTKLNYINELVEVFKPLVYTETTKKGKVLKLLKEENIIREIFDKIDNINNIHELLSSTLSEKDINLLSKETKKFIKEDKELILFKSRPFEKLNKLDNSSFNEIKKAIKEKRYLNIYDYRKPISNLKGYEVENYENIIPLKIIFMENNWYLAGVVNNKNNKIVRFFRISFIEDLEATDKFPKSSIKKEYLEFLETFETPFTLYGKKWKKAILRIAPDKIIYFEKKNQFPKQKVINKDKDNFLIEVGYTQPMELNVLVKKWIPDIEIVECEDDAKEKLKEELQKYLQKF